MSEQTLAVAAHEFEAPYVVHRQHPKRLALGALALGAKVAALLRAVWAIGKLDLDRSGRIDDAGSEQHNRQHCLNRVHQMESTPIHTKAIVRPASAQVTRKSEIQTYKLFGASFNCIDGVHATSRRPNDAGQSSCLRGSVCQYEQ